MEHRYELVMPNENLAFRLFRFEGQNENYKVTKHWYQSVELFAMTEGEIEFCINKDKYNLKKGDLLIVNSNEIHSITAEDPNHVIVLQIPFHHFDEYCEHGYIFFERDKIMENVSVFSQVFNLYQVYL